VKGLSDKAKLADALAIDFQRDLETDNIPSEEIQKRTTRSRERMLSAPVIILLSLDISEMDVYPDTKRSKAEYLMAVQSVANTGMQLLLAAHAEGLGGVWVCSPLFVQETIRNVLGLPETWEPQGMLYIGYPLEIPKTRERKPMSEITLFL
jgi:coenzyme F420-0:L-glutamate ligase/coenzyme F420-1:gamma-L-glutamate ligase